MSFDLETERQQLNEYARSYNPAAPFDIKMREYIMRTLDPYLHKGENCLQLGCGNGEQTVQLAQTFKHITVIEPVGTFIERTQALLDAAQLSNVTFVQKMVEEFSTTERFENIILSHVLEHIHDDIGVLKIMKDHLSATGRLFVIVPNAGAASRQIAVKMGFLGHTESLTPADDAAGHRRMYHLDKLCYAAKEAGLNIVNSGGVFFKPLANFQFDALMGGDLINDAFMEGCFELGKEHPLMCASIYVVASK